MKKINKHITLALFSGLLAFTSCETTELDLTQDPNALTPEQASADFFLNSLQDDFVRQLEGDADFSTSDNWSSGGNTVGDGFNIHGQEITRIAQLSGRSYASAYQASDMDDEWDNAYRGILADIRAMTPLAEEAGQTRHLGIAQFMEAYLMVTMVDFFGDVPYSEAIQGIDNLNPAFDSGASIYDACLVLLDQAIVNFTNTTTSNPSTDLYYNNNYNKWVKAANTLKMKIYLQRRLVDSSWLSSFNAIVNSGNYITSTADDFQYNWPATSATNPDTRHPRYGLNYQSAGANDYMSNWLMNLLQTTDDPRIRYYFYRQVTAVPGQEIAPNEETLRCSLQTPPAHYVSGGFTFCGLPNGYWGRDHGDSEGIPPDGLLRTTFGVYPVGGRFDDDSFSAIAQSNDATSFGGSGAGSTPILTAFGVDFMIAEAAMVQGNVGAARAAMLNGIAKSVAKVQSFIGLDSNADASFEPSATDISDYMDAVGTNFDAANMNGKWNALAEQYFVGWFGNGVEPYNFYRRTGFPTTLQPNREPNPGTVIRSMYYPSNSVNTNSNTSQKTDQTQPVFWDTGAAPVAN